MDVLKAISSNITASVKANNRTDRQDVARQFTSGCTVDSVLKTCVRFGFASSWIEKSYGITWVAVHSMDDSICVVTRRDDMDMTRVGEFHKTLPKHDVMYALTEAIVSEVEGFPYDDDFPERSGMIIKKPFGVVSVFPVTKKFDEESGQLASRVEYDKKKAINFFMAKMKSESVITLDDSIKMAISAFKHMCLQELETEEYCVTAFKGHGIASHLHVDTIEKHLTVINTEFGNGDSTNNDWIEEYFGVIKISSGSGGSTINETEDRLAKNEDVIYI